MLRIYVKDFVMKDSDNGINEWEISRYLQKGRRERSDMIAAVCKRTKRIMLKKIKLALLAIKTAKESESA